MKYTEFANEIDKHFAAIQKLLNENFSKESIDEADCCMHENLICDCIALNDAINDFAGSYLESE